MIVNIHTERVPLVAGIRLFDLTGAPLLFQAQALELVTLDADPIEIHLTVAADPLLYARISADGLFGLQVEARRPIDAELPPGLLTQLDLLLGGGLLVRLSGCRSATDAADLLLRRNSTQPEDVLFAISSWFAVSVRSADSPDDYHFSTCWADFAPARVAQKFTAEGIKAIIEAFPAFGSAPQPASPATATAVQSLLVQLTAYLEDGGWQYQRLESEESALQIFYQGAASTWTCFARVREDQHQVVFYSVFPTSVPESRRRTLSEFITRVNYGLIVGNFELDFEDGELRYKTCLEAAGGSLTPAQIHRSITTNLQTMDRYIASICAIITGLSVGAAEAHANHDGSRL
jgi:hypothetical protein